MRAVNYFICWLLTLFVGAVIAAFVGQDVQVAILCTLIAGVCSAPFILIFCIVMHHHLKKDPTTKSLHLTTFAYHIIGSLLTGGVMIAMAGGDVEIALVAVVFCYFVIDSVFFHGAIARYHRKEESKVSELDILDQTL